MAVVPLLGAVAVVGHGTVRRGIVGGILGVMPRASNDLATLSGEDGLRVVFLIPVGWTYTYWRAVGGGSTSMTEPTVAFTDRGWLSSEGANLDFFAELEWLTDDLRLTLPSGRSVPCVFL
jgi:hypothetical protein